MKWLRGIAVWLGAALMGSFLGTAFWKVAFRGPMSDLRVAVSIGLGSLFFTLIGSAIMSGLFAGMGSRSRRYRYTILVGAAGPVGAATMLFLNAPPAAVAGGAIYGVTTAIIWAGLQTVVGERAVSRS